MSAEKQLKNLLERYSHLAGCREEIRSAYLLLRETYEKGGMLLTCGNGGSGADCEHIAGELMKEFEVRRAVSPEMKRRLREISPDYGSLLAEHLQGSLPVIPLTGNMALSTAYANDALPQLVFAQQVYGYGNEDNTLLCISTSGNSQNILYAAVTARALNMKTIGLTGREGGRLRKLCDVCICVPAEATADVQELHLPVYHALCRMLEDTFFEGKEME